MLLLALILGAFEHIRGEKVRVDGMGYKPKPDDDLTKTEKEGRAQEVHNRFCCSQLCYITDYDKELLVMCFKAYPFIKELDKVLEDGQSVKVSDTTVIKNGGLFKVDEV